MLPSHAPSHNHLLAALPPAERERVYPHLQLVPMPLGKVLYESGDLLRHVYFPTDSIVSLLYVLEDGASADIAIVGNEGLIGVALFMGGETTPSRAVVQSAGRAYRLIGQQLKQEFHRNGELHVLLLRYTQALITQMTQTAVCNRHHSVDQQLCRWLLLSLDRLSSNQLTMTQELIADMLGVRREGVTEAAGKLQKLGVIRYARGQITVLDRTQLEHLCCECYGVVKRETDRLLPAPAPPWSGLRTQIDVSQSAVTEFLKEYGRRLKWKQGSASLLWRGFPVENDILHALLNSEYKHLSPKLEHVHLKRIIYQADQRIDHVYFPETAVVAMIDTVEGGGTVEVGIIGHEGMVGINIFLGCLVTPDKAIVQISGSAMRMKTSDLRKELRFGSPLQRLLLRHTQALLAIISQSVACSQHHTVGQRLARWLLTMHDQAAESNEFDMPHKSIAAMLGARREGVTEAAGKLQAAGLITYRRVRIQILDEAGLKKKSCECYRFIKHQFDGLLSDVPRFLSGKPRISGNRAR